MFFDLDIKADQLPPKTLCLTYDDGPGETAGAGPGPRTGALAAFLAERGVAATFFMIGQHIAEYPDLPRRLHALGHMVGNHTYTHPGLVALAQSGGDVVGEIARTGELIHDAVAGPVTFLRAPYGNWREKIAPDSDADRRTSIVAEILNRSGRFPSYVGPINWDISSLDWEFWGRGDPAASCATALLEKIERIGRGIVLMHDSSDDPSVRANNRTAETTRLLVPELQARGYRFVRLDVIPQVRSAVQVAALIALRSPEGHVLVLGEDGTIGAHAPSDAAQAREEVFGLVPAGPRQVALRASGGRFLSAAGAGLPMRAGPVEAGPAEQLQIEEIGSGCVALHSAHGYIGRGPDGRIRAGAGRLGSAETFVLHRRALQDASSG
jgi:peptidoglycan/xylan/chitin deacetylase (PgdA/CDA1 family)